MQKIKKHFVYIIILLVMINLFIPISIYAALPDFSIVESNNNNVEIDVNSKYKTAESSIQTTTNPVFSFQSGAQILMEATTGEIIYSGNENERLLPASVTKIMTLLLVMEQIDSGNLNYTDKVTCSVQASKMGGSQIWFKEGETLTIDEALKCVCVVSANDVSYALGELVGGTNENFVEMMNDKAKALGMLNTNFMNVHGIDEEGHYTTAKDIAIMSRELITKHPDITKYTTIWMDSIRNGTFELSNTNKLLKTYEGMTGLKTGSTSQALFNLSATATRAGLSLIAVVMKAPTSQIRNNEITALLNYGFSTYKSELIAKKSEIVDNININKHITGSVQVGFEKDEYLVTKKTDKTQYTKCIEYVNNLKAPIEKNTIIGKMKFLDSNQKLLYETNLIIKQDINKSSLWDYIVKIVNMFTIKEMKNM